MSRLPQPEAVQAKLAALRAADNMARHQAHTDVTVELAKVAGVLMAQGQADEMTKEALLGRLARRMVSGTRGTLQNVGSKLRARSAVSKAMSEAAPAGASTGPSILRRRAGKVTEVKPMSKSYVGGTGEVTPRAPKVETVMRRGQPSTGAGPRVAPAAQAPATKTAPKGTVKEAPKTAPKGKVQEAPSSPPAQEAKKPFSVGRMMWKNKGLLGLGALAGGIYGGGKAIGWAARQAEQASSSPMAYGGGWSPTPYGYGYSPYGPGQPTMGPGA